MMDEPPLFRFLLRRCGLGGSSCRFRRSSPCSIRPTNPPTPSRASAPTRAGKGVGAIIPALLTYPGSVIVTDIKGENYQVTARHRRELGQQVVVLDPFNLVTAKDKGDKLNPFDLFSVAGSDIESDAE